LGSSTFTRKILVSQVFLLQRRKFSAHQATGCGKALSPLILNPDPEFEAGKPQQMLEFWNVFISLHPLRAS